MENLQISIVSLEIDRQDNLFLTDYTSSILLNLHAMFFVVPFSRRSICMNLDILDTRSSVLKALKSSKYTYRASSCTKKQSALNSKYAYSSSLTSQNAYSSLPFSPVVQTLLTVLHHSTIHFLSSFFATIISS